MQHVFVVVVKCMFVLRISCLFFFLFFVSVLYYLFLCSICMFEFIVLCIWFCICFVFYFVFLFCFFHVLLFLHVNHFFHISHFISCFSLSTDRPFLGYTPELFYQQERRVCVKLDANTVGLFACASFLYDLF